MLFKDFKIKELDTDQLRGLIMELAKHLEKEKINQKYDQYDLKNLGEALQELIFRAEVPSDVKMSLALCGKFGLKTNMIHSEHKTQH